MAKVYIVQITEPKRLYVAICANSLNEALETAESSYDNGDYDHFNWEDTRCDAEFYVVGENEEEESV